MPPLSPPFFVPPTAAAPGPFLMERGPYLPSHGGRRVSLQVRYVRAMSDVGIPDINFNSFSIHKNTKLLLFQFFLSLCFIGLLNKFFYKCCCPLSFVLIILATSLCYRVRQKWSKSFEESPFVMWLTYPLGSLPFYSKNVLANREKIFFAISQKMTKLWPKNCGPQTGICAAIA